MSLTPALRRLQLALTAIDEREPLFVIQANLDLPSAGNAREHHFARARRVKATRKAVGLLLNTHGRMLRRHLAERDLVVRMVRCGLPHLELDSDNLAASLKGVRDEIARVLNIDDRDPRVEFVPDSMHAPESQLIVEVYPSYGAVERVEPKPTPNQRGAR